MVKLTQDLLPHLKMIWEKLRPYGRLWRFSMCDVEKCANISPKIQFCRYEKTRGVLLINIFCPTCQANVVTLA